MELFQTCSLFQLSDLKSPDLKNGCSSIVVAVLSKGNLHPGLAHSDMPEAWRDLQQRLSAVEQLMSSGDLEDSQLYACEMRRLRESFGNGVELQRLGKDAPISLRMWVNMV